MGQGGADASSHRSPPHGLHLLPDRHRPFAAYPRALPRDRLRAPEPGRRRRRSRQPDRDGHLLGVGSRGLRSRAPPGGGSGRRLSRRSHLRLLPRASGAPGGALRPAEHAVDSALCPRVPEGRRGAARVVGLAPRRRLAGRRLRLHRPDVPGVPRIPERRSPRPRTPRRPARRGARPRMLRRGPGGGVPFTAPSRGLAGLHLLAIRGLPRIGPLPRRPPRIRHARAPPDASGPRRGPRLRPESHGDDRVRGVADPRPRRRRSRHAWPRPSARPLARDRRKRVRAEPR